MTARVRVLVLLCRPPVLALLALFVATGLARSGHPADYVALARAVAVTVGFLLFSVALNDLADERIDRINLPGDARRPLVVGTAGRRDLVVAGLAGGVLAVVGAATIGATAVAVLLAGLAVSAGYSLRPIRIADRGALASMLLPACYVAVPYLMGVLSGQSWVSSPDVLLLAGLYVGFIGRILLKDFRDVRGDALFGKRTFLVRHGRAATCGVSAACWLVGALLLVGTAHHSRSYGLVTLAGAVAAVALLRALARSTAHRRDELLISALAILGRGLIVVLLIDLSGGRHAGLFVLAAATLFAGQIVAMLRYGPVAGLHASDLSSDDHAEEPAMAGRSA